MSIPTYVQGFPPDGSNLGNTRVQIRDNLDGTFLTLAVDHINNNGDSPTVMGTKGYHNVIHFQNQGNLPTTPSATVGSTQMYTNTDSHSIQQVVLQSTAGNFYQQTTMLDTFRSRFGDDLSVNTAGWTFLPGGLIQNYGYVGKNTASQVINFPALLIPSFSNKNYIIVVTPWANATSSTPISFLILNTNTALTVDQFTIQNISGLNIGYYWTATGTPA